MAGKVFTLKNIKHLLARDGIYARVCFGKVVFEDKLITDKRVIEISLERSSDRAQAIHILRKEAGLITEDSLGAGLLYVRSPNYIWPRSNNANKP